MLFQVSTLWGLYHNSHGVFFVLFGRSFCDGFGNGFRDGFGFGDCFGDYRGDFGGYFGRSIVGVFAVIYRADDIEGDDEDNESDSDGESSFFEDFALTGDAVFSEVGFGSARAGDGSAEAMTFALLERDENDEGNRKQEKYAADDVFENCHN